jgi:hypothetical protein
MQEPFRGSSSVQKSAGKAEVRKRAEVWAAHREYLQQQAIHAPDAATRVRAQEMLREQQQPMGA